MTLQEAVTRYRQWRLEKLGLVGLVRRPMPDMIAGKLVGAPKRKKKKKRSK